MTGQRFFFFQYLDQHYGADKNSGDYRNAEYQYDAEEHDYFDAAEVKHGFGNEVYQYQGGDKSYPDRMLH